MIFRLVVGVSLVVGVILDVGVLRVVGVVEGSFVAGVGLVGGVGCGRRDCRHTGEWNMVTMSAHAFFFCSWFESNLFKSKSCSNEITHGKFAGWCVCMCVYILYIYMCECTFVHIWVYHATHTHMHTQTHCVPVYAQTLQYPQQLVHMYLHTYVLCVYIHSRICANTYMYIYTSRIISILIDRS